MTTAIRKENMDVNHIKIEKLNLWYQGTHVLKDINVGIPRHQVTAIIGPSGCGKTTLLRCINRMIDLFPGTRAEGRVLLDGFDIYERGVDVTAIRKRIGLISQKPVLLPMSIFENVAYGPRIYGAGGRKEAEGDRRTLPEDFRPLGRSEEQAERTGHKIINRPAAAPVRSPRPCRRA